MMRGSRTRVNFVRLRLFVARRPLKLILAIVSFYWSVFAHSVISQCATIHDRCSTTMRFATRMNVFFLCWVKASKITFECFTSNAGLFFLIAYTFYFARLRKKEEIARERTDLAISQHH